MEAESPQIIGIVGGSCAGKTWLAGRLQAALGVDRSVRLSLDDFYLDRSHLSPGRRARVNFDHPRAIDWDRLESVLEAWAAGKSAAVPRYDFVTHGRMREERVLQPARYVIAEGLWLFRRPALRQLFHLRIFIRSSVELCRQRRLRRDTSERGRSPEQVVEQFNRYTLPMFERFVAPQERWAHVVLEAPVAEKDVELLTKEFCSDQVGI
jgi:uridine kinase